MRYWSIGPSTLEEKRTTVLAHICGLLFVLRRAPSLGDRDHVLEAGTHSLTVKPANRLRIRKRYCSKAFAFAADGYGVHARGEVAKPRLQVFEKNIKTLCQ